MPCWYYEKKEIKNSPSFQDGIDSATEARYRREGARFILDAGTKMGLRYDTCATGVVYFHRFYMFHSFKEFHRYVTAACCLFLAGKVEETPKKCKDIIKTCQQLLSPQSFAVFGDDPREEVMTLERILLQTIKFDLQVEHPYAHLLKYAKILRGDKEKIQKMAQMSWTFINDSLCTTLSLQWEPEIISVSLMYLASRLTKYDVQDWHGKMPGMKMKWWEFFVEDLSMELMEDICHQVLDLYSHKSEKKIEESPPISPSPRQQALRTPPSVGSSVSGKKSQPATPSEVSQPTEPKKPRISESEERRETIEPSKRKSSQSVPPPAATVPTTSSQAPMNQHQPHPTGPPTTTHQNENFSSNNPYVSSKMYSSSFMSQEGSQSIQTLISQSSRPAQYPTYPQQATPTTPVPQPQYSQPPPAAYQPHPSYAQPAYPSNSGYQGQPPPPGQPPPASQIPPPVQPAPPGQPPPPGQPVPMGQHPNPNQPPHFAGPYPSYPPPPFPPTTQPPAYQPPYPYPQYSTPPAYPAGGVRPPPSTNYQQPQPQPPVFGGPPPPTTSYPGPTGPPPHPGQMPPRPAAGPPPVRITGTSGHVPRR